jgi:LPXTG-motif cell wall-anchored protein
VVKWTKADGSTKISNESSDGDKPNQVSYASNTFTVGNTPGASLPATGGPGTTLYYVAGSALLLLAIATLIFRKKADDE